MGLVIFIWEALLFFLTVFLWGRHTKADLLTVLNLLRMLMNREVC